MGALRRRFFCAIILVNFAAIRAEIGKSLFGTSVCEDSTSLGRKSRTRRRLSLRSVKRRTALSALQGGMVVQSDAVKTNRRICRHLPVPRLEDGDYESLGSGWAPWRSRRV